MQSSLMIRHTTKKRSSIVHETAFKKRIKGSRCYIGTINLFVSSFQVTTKYHTIIAAIISNRVGP